MSVAGRSVTDGSFRVAARLTATAGDSRKLPARALASSRESTSIRSATSPAQAPAKYFCCSSAERSSRAVKNRSFARGFQVVMVGVRLGRKCHHLSVREIRAVCARKKNDTQKFVPKLGLGDRILAGPGSHAPAWERGIHDSGGNYFDNWRKIQARPSDQRRGCPPPRPATPSCA